MKKFIMKFKSIPELLAPAGSMDALKTAVIAGADAIYLAGKSFSARHYAENFNRIKMEEAIDYSHLHGTKVYVTINTLIKDFEFEKVAEYLLWLYKTGADAVILQDIGIAALCRDLVPNLDMHASTQMTINSLEEVKWAENFGFKRVVLSREMKVEDVNEISYHLKRDKIELEIFAHGALCYCYSGQCLLSSFIGGRSGNRGRCAQPCRKSYELLKGEKDKYGKIINHESILLKENYLLSTRDLSLYHNLKKIYNLIDSIKIEGRMKSPEYVAIVVSIYRKLLDSIVKGTGIPNENDYYKLKLAFNRNFTKGHLLETNKNMIMGRDAPGNRGLFVGLVSDYENKTKSALINLKIPFKLEPGDGIVFIFPDNEQEYGMIIEKSPNYSGKKLDKITLKTKKLIPIGSKVYITRDASLINTAQKIINKETPSIPLDLHIKWDKENKLTLKGEFSGFNGNKHVIHFKPDFKMETAINKPLSKELIINQIKKTGGTPFYVNRIKINYPGNLFTPLSKLNSIRRDFIKNAEIKLLNDYKPLKSDLKSAEKRLNLIKHDLKSERKKSNKSIDVRLNKSLDHSIREVQTSIGIYASNLETVKCALNGGCRHIYFEPFLWEKNIREVSCQVMDKEIYLENIYELILKAQDLCINEEANLIWKWPSIISPRYFKTINSIINPLINDGINKIMVGSYGIGWSLFNLNPHIKLYSSSGVNVWNNHTIRELSNIFHSITISNELSKNEIALIISKTRYNGIKTSFEFIVQGNMESIISEDCLSSILPEKEYNNKTEFLGIKDMKNRVFPIIIDDECRTHILNSVELCLIDYLPNLYKMGLQYLIIDARGKTGNYTHDMIKFYRQGLKYMEETNGKTEYKLNKLKYKIQKRSHGGITTGNFIRGLNEDL
jgi:putative protease